MKCPQCFECPIPRAPRSGMSQKKAMTQELPDADSTTPPPKAIPPVPTNNVEVPPRQPTTNLTTDVLQSFMLSSMKNQAQMAQLMRTMVANQATMQQAIQQVTLQQTTLQQTATQQAAMQQTVLLGNRDSGTMTVELVILETSKGKNRLPLKVAK